MKSNPTKAPSPLRPRAFGRLGQHHRRFALVALFCGCGMTLSCEQPGPRVYSAMAFDQTAHCLAPYAPLGLVQAEDLPATCAPVCLMLAGTLYVSEVCPPYPAEAALVNAADSPDCATALTLVGVDGGACVTDAP